MRKSFKIPRYSLDDKIKLKFIYHYYFVKDMSRLEFLMRHDTGRLMAYKGYYKRLWDRYGQRYTYQTFAKKCRELGVDSALNTK